MSKQNPYIIYLNSISIGVISFLFFMFPLLFLINTFDAFTFPKQIFVTLVAIILLITSALKSLLQGKIAFRSTPLSLPIFFLGIVFLISSLLSKNIYDSLIQTIPVIAIIIVYFSILNSVQNKNEFKILLYSLFAGALLSSLITILHFERIYVFPFPEVKIQYFNTFGSFLNQLIYLIPLFLISLYNTWHLIKEKNRNIYDSLVFSFSLVIFTSTIILVVYEMISTNQKILMLPYVYGFQIAFDSISKDSGRFFQSLFFGSGYGNFVADFTKYKSLLINQEKDLWNIVFPYSSSYMLEILSTTGILGLLSFIFLTFRTIKTKIEKQTNIYYLLCVLLLALSFLFTLFYPILFLLFVLLSLYSVTLYLDKTKFAENNTLSIVNFRQGLINLDQESLKKVKTTHEAVKADGRILPLANFIILVIISGFIGFYTVRLLISDIQFKESGKLQEPQKIRQKQIEAILSFPYRSDYLRNFSRLNINYALLASNSLSKESSPSAQQKQEIIQLIETSIETGKQAISLAPLSAVNWQNLSQIYRNLINLGQNADQFTILSLAQAINLDPTNPLLRVELGGVYNQLGLYEKAQNQFEIAISLKNDFANAYYNLGHVLEAKGNLQEALLQYQKVKSLVTNDKTSSEKIDKEIQVLQEKIKNKNQETSTQLEDNNQIQSNNSSSQLPLQVSSSSATFPPQKQPIKIPEPPISQLPSSRSATPITQPTPSVGPTTQP